jgi:PAS domain S-box-containing protein
MPNARKSTGTIIPKSKLLDQLRKKAEILLDSKGLTLDMPEMIETQKLFHELQIQQLELEMQNDELSAVALELEVQKAKFSRLFELAPVGYLVLNNKGAILDINQTGSRLFGLRKQLLLNKALAGFVYADDVSIFYDFFRRVLSGADEQDCQVRMFNSGQSAFYAQLNGICTGKPNSFNCYITLTDITEKKQAELELMKAKQRLDTALSASLTGIWEIDVTTGRIFLDDFSRTIFGLQSYNFDGKYTSLMAHIDSADQEIVDSALRTAIVREKDFNIEFSIHTPDGKQKHINAKGQVIYDEGINRHFTGTVTDITEKKRLEKEMLLLKENQQHDITAASLQVEERARRNISESLHDSVGQTLYAMKINLDQLKEVADNTNYKQVNQLLNQVIHDVRDLSFELAPSILKDFGLTTTLKEMSRRLSTKNLSIKVFGADLSHLEMDMAVNIYRIVQELVNNSIKHAEASQIDIELAKKRNTVYIQVKDNGKGFPANKRSHNTSGTGLSSIRNRLNLYQGAMDIESQENKGATVSVRLKQS